MKSQNKFKDSLVNTLRKLKSERMREWHIKVTRRFERDFRKLPNNIQVRIIELVEELRSNPYLGKKLRNFPYYSLRVGDYRVIYMIDERERVIILMTVFHRRVGYRRITSS